MSGILQKLASRHGLAVKNAQAWGSVEDYWFQVGLPARGSDVIEIRMAAALVDHTAASAVADGLADMQRRNPGLSFTRDSGAVTLRLGKPSGASGADLVDAVLLRLASLFRKAGAPPACFRCGAPAPEGFAMADGAAVKLCAQCMSGVSTGKQSEGCSARGSYLRGFLGALAGALLGALAWVLIGYLGFIAALGGLAISFCAVKGYRLMRGREAWPAVVIVCCVSVAAMLAAEYMTWGLLALRENAGVHLGFILARLMSLLLSGGDLTAEFVKDSALGLLFLALGGFRPVMSLLARARAQGKIVKL